jgi:hypothetical protein
MNSLSRSGSPCAASQRCAISIQTSTRPANTATTDGSRPCGRHPAPSPATRRGEASRFYAALRDRSRIPRTRTARMRGRLCPSADWRTSASGSAGTPDRAGRTAAGPTWRTPARSWIVRRSSASRPCKPCAVGRCGSGLPRAQPDRPPRPRRPGSRRPRRETHNAPASSAVRRPSLPRSSPARRREIPSTGRCCRCPVPGDP